MLKALGIQTQCEANTLNHWRKDMVGTRRLELLTSTVSILRATIEGMRRSRRKLQRCKALAQFQSQLTWLSSQVFASSCTGMDARVTSQATSQFCESSRFRHV